MSIVFSAPLSVLTAVFLVSCSKECGSALGYWGKRAPESSEVISWRKRLEGFRGKIFSDSWDVIEYPLARQNAPSQH
jgi:hypothetical protein